MNQRSLRLQALLCAAVLVVALSAEAQEPEIGVEKWVGHDKSATEILVEANAAYEEGEYSYAVESYEQLLSLGYDASVLHYNLGNAFLRGGELGRSIAAYQRARARAPRDQDVLANLDFARQSTKDDLSPPQASATVQTLFFWHFVLSGDELWVVLLIGNLLLWLLGCYSVWRGRLAEWTRWTMVAVVLVTAASGGSLSVRAVAPVQIAVVVPAEVNVLAAMRTDAVVRFVLHGGSEVRVEAESDDWLRVSLPDGQQGWLERRYLEIFQL